MHENCVTYTWAFPSTLHVNPSSQAYVITLAPFQVFTASGRRLGKWESIRCSLSSKNTLRTLIFDGVELASGSWRDIFKNLLNEFRLDWLSLRDLFENASSV